MSQPFISIITPTYNHEDYVEQCIKSVQQQSHFNNWELLVIDDHSTDSTIKIVNKLRKTDKRIKLIIHNNNWGIQNLQHTYNQAIKICQGEFVAILEGDDYWPKDKLISQVSALQNDNNAVLSYGKWELVNNGGRHIYIRNYPFNKDKLNNTPIHSIFDLFLNLQFDIVSSTVLIKRNALEKIGGIQSDTYYPFTDIPTYLALAKIGKFVFIDKVLGCYRRSQKSAWLAFVKETRNMGREEMRQCINNFIINKINKNLINKKITNKQNLFLFVRRNTMWMSLLFNKFIQ